MDRLPFAFCESVCMTMTNLVEMKQQYKLTSYKYKPWRTAAENVAANHKYVMLYMTFQNNVWSYKILSIQSDEYWTFAEFKCLNKRNIHVQHVAIGKQGEIECSPEEIKEMITYFRPLVHMGRLSIDPGKETLPDQVLTHILSLYQGASLGSFCCTEYRKSLDDFLQVLLQSSLLRSVTVRGAHPWSQQCRAMIEEFALSEQCKRTAIYDTVHAHSNSFFHKLLEKKVLTCPSEFIGQFSLDNEDLGELGQACCNGVGKMGWRFL